MTRLLVLGLCLASSAVAQLATSRDGAQFDFTSCAALKQEPITRNGCRIYRHGPEPAIQLESSESFEITAPYLSSDGNVSGAFGSIEGRRAVRILAPGGSETFEGNWLAISRNARFVATAKQPEGLLIVRDRDTGTQHSYPFEQIVFAFGTISNQGDLVFVDRQNLWFIPFGQPRSLLIADSQVTQASITAAGDQAFIATVIPPGKLNFTTTYTLTAIDLTSRARRLLYQGDKRFDSFTLSASGQRLLMQRPEELLLWDRDAGWSSLLSHDEGISTSLLSDDGNTAFASTGTNRHLRIDTNSSEVTQLYAPFPFHATQISGGALPGSILRFSLHQFRPGLRLVVDGRELPIVKSEPGILDAQIPWDATGYLAREFVAEITAPDSPFSLRRPVAFANTIEPWAFTFPAWFGITKFSETHLVAANADFTKRIDPANPTTPGSLVHFWLTGLGPLDNPVPTAQPAPTTPLSRPLAKLTCTISNSQESFPLEVLDLIYAPNLIGVYQADIRIPANWSTSRANIRCSSGSSPETGGLITIEVPQP